MKKLFALVFVLSLFCGCTATKVHYDGKEVPAESLVGEITKLKVRVKECEEGAQQLGYALVNCSENYQALIAFIVECANKEERIYVFPEEGAMTCGVPELPKGEENE